MPDGSRPIFGSLERPPVPLAVFSFREEAAPDKSAGRVCGAVSEVASGDGIICVAACFCTAADMFAAESPLVVRLEPGVSCARLLAEGGSSKVFRPRVVLSISCAPNI